MTTTVFSLLKQKKKVHGDESNHLSVGRGKGGIYRVFFNELIQLTTGIADDAHIPSSERNIIERHDHYFS